MRRENKDARTHEVLHVWERKDQQKLILYQPIRDAVDHSWHDDACENATVPRGIAQKLCAALEVPVARTRTYERVTHRATNYFASKHLVPPVKGISGPDWSNVHRRVTDIKMPGRPGWTQIEDQSINGKWGEWEKELPDQYRGLTMRTTLYYTARPFIAPTAKRRRQNEEEDEPEDISDVGQSSLAPIPEDDGLQLEDADADLGDPDDEEAPPVAGWWPSDQELRDLKISHDNAGHPTNADFARLLRRGSAKPEIANWVRNHFHCPDWESNKRPAARRPAAVPKTNRFNHVVGIDLVKARNNTTNEKEWWANVVCWGTGYQQVWRLGNDDSKSAENTWAL